MIYEIVNILERSIGDVYYRGATGGVLPEDAFIRSCVCLFVLANGEVCCLYNTSFFLYISYLIYVVRSRRLYSRA